MVQKAAWLGTPQDKKSVVVLITRLRLKYKLKTKGRRGFYHKTKLNKANKAFNENLKKYKNYTFK